MSNRNSVKSERGGPRIAAHSKRAVSDFFKLLGTAVLIVATVVMIAIGCAKYNISRVGTTRLLAALMCLSVGAVVLYGTRKQWNYLRQLPDSVGNRKIKRQQNMFLIIGVLFLLVAAWTFWLFASLE